jgi:hypothetical protein
MNNNAINFGSDTESEPEIEQVQVPEPKPKKAAPKKKATEPTSSESEPENQENQENQEPKAKKPREPKKKAAPIHVPLADSDNLKFLGITELETQQLRLLFGEPQENPDQDPETMDWRYEYKIKVGTKLYAVYDKLNEDDTFDPEDSIEWFANGTGTVKHLQSAF